MLTSNVVESWNYPTVLDSNKMTNSVMGSWKCPFVATSPYQIKGIWAQWLGSILGIWSVYLLVMNILNVGL
jgi:hypothetical protein